jgi:hypothetical protein
MRSSMRRPGWAMAVSAAAVWGGVLLATERRERPIEASEQAVTFAEHVAPIIFKNCTSCHRPGEAAPFPLQTYDQIAKRGSLIAEVVHDRYMPPWQAEPSSYHFKDERRLAAKDIATIERWVDAGMPKGDLRKAPALPTFTPGWQLGEPDLVLEMPAAFNVPADGPDIYRSFVVPLGLADEKWIRAIELRPSSRSVVHHVLFFADASGAAREADAADASPGFTGMRRGVLRNTPLGGWAVGQQPHMLPDGIAMSLPARSDLVLQFHFHPTGKAQTERSVIGLHFADRAPERQLSAIQLPVLFGFFAGIDIPAGERRFSVEDSFVLPIDVEGVAIGAHAHYLGRELGMTAVLPDGSTRTLLSIVDWDFAWQDRYVFEQLVPLPKGTRLTARILWDNSAANPHNPSDPPVRVTWGEQSSDEMGSVTLQVVPRLQRDLPVLQQSYRQHVLRTAIGGRR